ncbi:hypothetical protein V5799_029006 [Amblyomma americanum]|uniref:CCHC-type domain-containing protein n=1 Tax=Amblyomma americanum TaxID=6943 RepID=A0AAQ4ESQ7_AMBAM
MSDTSHSRSCGGPRSDHVVMPPAGGKVKVEVEPLEHPPLPPSPLIRLFETGSDAPFSETPGHQDPQAVQSKPDPMFVTHAEADFPFTYAFGMNYASNVPLVYLPCVYQAPLLGASSRWPVVMQESTLSTQERVSSDDPVPERDTGQVHESQTGCSTRQAVNDVERIEKPTVNALDEREFRPLRCDSPRSIASSYQRGMNDVTGDRVGNGSATGDSKDARISGVPVFIQASGDRSLMDIPLVDLIVAVSLIAGTAPSQHKFTTAGCLLVDMPSVEGVNRLLHCDSLCGVGVHASIPYAYQKSSSVIRDVPTSYTDSQLLDALRDQGVVHVKRLTRLSYHGETAAVTRTPTEKVVLTFRRNTERPLDVQLGSARYKLRDFVDKPARCFNCQRLGHISRHCFAQQRCKRCSGHHDITDCPQNHPKRCSNCGGPHYPSYKGCPAYAEALKYVKSILNVL